MTFTFPPYNLFCPLPQLSRRLSNLLSYQKITKQVRNQYTRNDMRKATKTRRYVRGKVTYLPAEASSTTIAHSMIPIFPEMVPPTYSLRARKTTCDERRKDRICVFFAFK